MTNSSGPKVTRESEEVVRSFAQIVHSSRAFTDAIDGATASVKQESSRNPQNVQIAAGLTRRAFEPGGLGGGGGFGFGGPTTSNRSVRQATVVGGVAGGVVGASLPPIINMIKDFFFGKTIDSALEAASPAAERIARLTSLEHLQKEVADLASQSRSARSGSLAILERDLADLRELINFNQYFAKLAQETFSSRPAAVQERHLDDLRSMKPSGARDEAIARAEAELRQIDESADFLGQKFDALLSKLGTKAAEEGTVSRELANLRADPNRTLWAQQEIERLRKDAAALAAQREIETLRQLVGDQVRVQQELLEKVLNPRNQSRFGPSDAVTLETILKNANKAARQPPNLEGPPSPPPPMLKPERALPPPVLKPLPPPPPMLKPERALPPIPTRRPEVIRGEKELLKAVEDTTQALGDQRAAFEALAGPEGRGALHQLALSGEVFSDLPPLLTEVGEAAERAGPAVAGLLPAPDLLDQAAAGLESFAGTAEQRFSETADRLQDGLGETILDIFDGASPKQALKSFAAFAKASFSGLLQDLAQAALRNPIVINFVQQLTNGLSGGLISLGSGLLRGAGSFFGLGGGGGGAGVGGFAGGQFDLGTLGSLGRNFLPSSYTSGLTASINSFGANFGFANAAKLGAGGPAGLASGAGVFGDVTFSQFLGGAGIGSFGGALLADTLGLRGSGNFVVDTAASGVGGFGGAAAATALLAATPLAPVAPILGALIGSFASKALTSLLGKKEKKPTAQILTRGTVPSAEELASGVFFDSEFVETPFGVTGFNGGATRKVSNQLVKDYLTFLEGFDDAIAGFLEEDQVAAGRAALVAKGEGLKEKFKDFDGEAFTLAADRLETILQGALGEAAAAAVIGKVDKPESGDPKEVEAAIQQLLLEAQSAATFINDFDKNLGLLSEGTIDFADKALEQARQSVDQTIAAMDNFRERTEELELDTEAADAALGQLVRSMIGLKETTSEALGPLDAARQAIDAQFDAWEERLDDLAKFGITQEDLDAGRQLKQAQALDDFIAGFQNGIDEIVDPVAARLEALNRQEQADLDQAKRANATEEQLTVIRTFYGLERERQAEATAQAVAAAMAEALQPVIAEIQNDITSRQALIRSFESAAENIARFRQSLLVGPDSPLSPKARLEAARGEFDRLARLAQGGDINAINELPGAAQAFLQASRDFNGITGFAPDFDRVQDVLASTETIAEREIRIQEEQLEVLRQQLAVLRDDESGIPPDIDGVSALSRAIRGDRNQILDLAIDTNDLVNPLFGPSSVIEGLGISRGRRNAIARALGYQGGFGGGEFASFREANPSFNQDFLGAVEGTRNIVAAGLRGIPDLALQLSPEQIIQLASVNFGVEFGEELERVLGDRLDQLIIAVGGIVPDIPEGPGGIVNSILDINQKGLTTAVTGSRAEVEALGFGGNINDVTQFGINALRRNAIARTLGYTGNFGGGAFNDFYSSGVDPAFNQAFIQQVNARLAQASREQLSLQVPGVDTPPTEGAVNPFLPPTGSTPIASHPTEPETNPVTAPTPDPTANDNSYTPSRREIAIFGDYAQALALGHGGARDIVTNFGISQFRRNAIARELGFSGEFGGGNFGSFYRANTGFQSEFDDALRRRERAKAAGELGRFPPRFQFGGLAERGLAIVGEAGPELVNFNAPGFVHTAQETRRFFDFARIAGALREIANDEREQRLARVQQAEIHHQEQRDEMAALRREIRELRDMMARRAELRQRVAA